jgi:hypothetical protein
LNELALLLISFTKTNHHFNNNILTHANPQSFILSMLTISKHKILPHSKSKTCNIAILPTCMLLHIVKLRNQ